MSSKVWDFPAGLMEKPRVGDTADKCPQPGLQVLHSDTNPKRGCEGSILLLLPRADVVGVVANMDAFSGVIVRMWCEWEG